jgi:hypothetical protein
MDRAHRLRRRTQDIVTVVVLYIVLARRWIPEVVIVALILVLLLVELGLRLSAGAHTLAHLVVWGLLFGLIALWVYVNRAALAAWEQQDTEERDR